MLHIHSRFLTMLMQIVCEEFSGFLLCYLRAWSLVVFYSPDILFWFNSVLHNLPFIFSVLCCWHMSIVFSFSLYLAGLACWFCINFFYFCCGTWSLEWSPTSCYFYQLLDSSTVTNIGSVIENCSSLQLNFFF